MHSKGNYKNISKILKSKLDCPGISWKTPNINGDGDFDLEILPLLKLLNTNSWHTVASCAGHSKAYLSKPLHGYGSDRPFTITIYIHVKTNSQLGIIIQSMKKRL